MLSTPCSSVASIGDRVDRVFDQCALRSGVMRVDLNLSGGAICRHTARSGSNPRMHTPPMERHQNRDNDAPMGRERKIGPFLYGSLCPPFETRAAVGPLFHRMARLRGLICRLDTNDHLSPWLNLGTSTSRRWIAHFHGTKC